MNEIIIVSGPPGAGKSAVAEALCERYDRMLHVEVDVLRHLVRAGYRHPWEHDPQAAEQRDLATRNACAIAREAIATRYAVVISDVVHAAEAEGYRRHLAALGVAVHLVTLLPPLEVVLSRDAGRRYAIPERARAVHAELAAEAGRGALPGAVIDSGGDATPQVTADRVQDLLPAGAALLLRPA